MPLIIEADPNRCQAVITREHGPFVLGPPPRPERCDKKPTLILVEKSPGEDGQHGYMSSCADCFDHLPSTMIEGTIVVRLK